MITRLRLATLLAIPALALLAPPAAAFDLADGKLDLGVSGQVAYGRTSNRNTYGPGNQEGQYDNTLLALSVLGHVSDQLTVVARLDLEKEGAEIDWAFAEWKVSDALRVRVGMGKHAFGSYGEIIEEGTLRPFFDPPSSIYGLANIAGEGYTGAGITGFHRLGAWGLSYDLYGGELDVETSSALARIADPAIDPSEEFVIETRDMIGGRVTVETPVEGLAARLSAYTGVEEEYPLVPEDTRHSAVAVSGEYLGESLSLRAEWAYMTEKEASSTNAAYVEAAWLFKSGFQVAGRVEGSWTELDGFTGTSPNLRHREAAIGLDYWFDRNFVVKAEYHLVDGNRFAYAPWGEAGVAPSPIPVPSETTHLFLVGAQFAL